jgi:hypothetical protein
MSDGLTELDKSAKNEVTFMSRAGAYKLVRKDETRTYNEVGQPLSQSPAVRYKFRNNVLKVRPGRDIMREVKPLWLAEGEDPDAERDAVDALKAHRHFNREFWVAGEEPGRPRPFEEVVLKEMAEAVARIDLDRLNALLDAERSTHNRPILTGALASAVESVSRVVAELGAQDTVNVHGDGENAQEWYETMTVAQLQEVADANGVEVKGTGKDGNVLHGDLVKALRKATPKSERKG